MNKSETRSEIKTTRKTLQCKLDLIYLIDKKLEDIEYLKNQVKNIFYNEPISCSYEELYNRVENLCTLQEYNALYIDLNLEIRHFLELHLENLLTFLEGNFLENLKVLWKLYYQKSKLIRNIYLYFEATSYKFIGKKLSISLLFMSNFEKIILVNADIKKRLDFIFDLIYVERNGGSINIDLLSDIIEMLSILSLYQDLYENEYLSLTKTYYTNQRDILLQGGIIEYIYYVQTKLSEEESRISSYMKSSTWNIVKKKLYEIFLSEELSFICNNLERINIFAKCFCEITAVYNLFSVLEIANVHLLKIYENYLMSKGSEIISKEQTESNIIPQLIKFKDRNDDMTMYCFKNCEDYVETVKTCFKKFINERKNKPAQLLAKFIDIKMREKLIPEQLLDKVMVLFRYINGKDIFEAYYKRYLSKRLLLGKSSSQDAEKSMISKLKVECGDSFTFKLEGMFKDMDLSDNLTNNFKYKHNTTLKLDFTTNVLTNSFWPTYEKHSVVIPEKMAYYETLFHDFYKTKHSGRSLQWIPALGSCIVKACMKEGIKEFQVSLFQALVLLLFNNSNTLTYKAIQMDLNLNDFELKRTLISMLHKKTKILQKNTSYLDINDEDEFQVNEAFTHKLFRIKINQLQFKETEEDYKITEKEIIYDRNLQIDAAIVRLMKQNQKIRHNELMTNLFDILKFPINQNDIKKRIEILIERDFLRRNPDDSSSYIYVA